MLRTSLILLLSLVLDTVLGDPRYRLHPVRMVGALVSYAEGVLRRMGWNGRASGGLLWVVTQITVLGIISGLWLVLGGVHSWAQALFGVYLCYSFVALRDLLDHVRKVLHALEAGDLQRARERLSMVVGRDVWGLDQAGVARAALETLAENFVDGFCSPLFWFVLGALVGDWWDQRPERIAVLFMAGFKVTSTLDSMVGYRHEPYNRLGWASARMDDLMNFIPARMGFVPLSLGALVAGGDLPAGLRTFLADRLKHDSPNAAHAESFMAGILGVRLGGPTPYEGKVKDKPWLGEGFPDPSTTDIPRAMRIVLVSSCFAVLLLEIPLMAGRTLGWFHL